MQKKQLYHHCFECDDIQDGDVIPVGGGIIGSTDMPWKVKIDFAQFYPKFAEIAERNGKQFEDPAWQNWFKQLLPDIDPKLITALQTFTTAFEAKRQAQSNVIHERKLLYDRAEGQCLPLSEVFGSNHARCVEMALLAKKYLDEKNIKSRLFCGETMFSHDPEDVNVPIAHTFLLIEHQGQEYIFDPANPTQAQGGNMLFSLLKPCVPFASREEDLKKDSLMIAAENVITHRTAYYGVGDCGNIPENYIIHGSKTARCRDKGASSEAHRE